MIAFLQDRACHDVSWDIIIIYPAYGNSERELAGSKLLELNSERSLSL